MKRENDPVVQAILVEDDNPEVFREPAKKPKTSTKPYVEVPEPSDMNFVRRPESKRAPRHRRSARSTRAWMRSCSG